MPNDAIAICTKIEIVVVMFIDLLCY